MVKYNPHFTAGDDDEHHTFRTLRNLHRTGERHREAFAFPDKIPESILLSASVEELEGEGELSDRVSPLKNPGIC